MKKKIVTEREKNYREIQNNLWHSLSQAFEYNFFPSYDFSEFLDASYFNNHGAKNENRKKRKESYEKQKRGKKGRQKKC